MGLMILQDGSERLFYPDPAIPIYVNRGDLKSLPGMAALCHWHEDVELLLPLRGSLRYNVNGTVVSVQEGDAIFVNARQMHYGFSADGSDCAYICITFRPQLLCGNEALASRYVLPVITSPNLSSLVLRRIVPEHGAVLGAIHRLDALYRNRKPGCELQAMGILFDLWQGIFELVRDHVGEGVSTDANVLILKRMLEFIRTQYQERVSVDAIAASGGVCRTKCCQLFKQYLGRTPNDYLNSFRLEQGMLLLKATSLSVTEIALRCGFGSASYFTELFTRQKGITPTAFRRQ